MNPFLTVWTQPRQTTRYIIDNKSIPYTFIFIAIGGIGSLASSLEDTDLHNYLSVALILPMLIILAPLLYIGLSFIFAGFTYLLGKAFGGVGSFADVFKAGALSYIPYILFIPIYFSWILFNPDSYFNSTTDPSPAVIIFSSIALVGITIYAFIVQIIAISEAHQFSKWRSFLIIVLPSIAILVLILLFVFIIAIIAVGVFSLAI